MSIVTAIVEWPKRSCHLGMNPAGDQLCRMGVAEKEIYSFDVCLLTMFI
jgi:hypothetical protein